VKEIDGERHMACPDCGFTEIGDFWISQNIALLTAIQDADSFTESAKLEAERKNNDSDWFWKEEWQKGEREVDDLYERDEYEEFQSLREALESRYKCGKITMPLDQPITKDESL
jgi:hypothetical protein